MVGVLFARKQGILHQVVSERPSVLIVELDITWPSVKILRSLSNLVLSSGTESASLSRSETSQERSRDVGTSTMHVGSNNNSVLLQTAQAFISRPDNQETGKYTQVIFDSCSHQRSCITSKTREQLNLPTVGKETLLIKTFGDNSASVKECDIVKLCIRTIDAMIVYVTAYVVPVVCSPVSNQEIQ